jgi:hypothetical protein
MQAIIHKVLGAVGRPQRRQEALTRMRIHHRRPVEDDIASVRTVLPLEARATVLYLLVAYVQLGRGQPADDVTAVQVAIPEKEAGLLGRVVGEVAAALHRLAELLADGVDAGAVRQVGKEIHLFVGVGVAEAGGEVGAFRRKISVGVAVVVPAVVARQECCCRDQKEGGGCQDPDHFWSLQCRVVGMTSAVMPMFQRRCQFIVAVLSQSSFTGFQKNVRFI